MNSRGSTESLEISSSSSYRTCSSSSSPSLAINRDITQIRFLCAAGVGCKSCRSSTRFIPPAVLDVVHHPGALRHRDDQLREIDRNQALGGRRRRRRRGSRSSRSRGEKGFGCKVYEFDPFN